MKKMLLSLAMATMAVGAANAQDAVKKAPDQDRAEMRTEHMVKELGLNEDQTAKVKEINARYGEKMQAMRQAQKAELTEKRDKRAELEEARMTELKGVLTPDQYAKLEARQKEMRDKRMEHRQEMRAKPMKQDTRAKDAAE